MADLRADALAAADATRWMFGAHHGLHIRACVAFADRNYAQARALHTEVLVRCRAAGYHGGEASSLCDLAMIDLAEGDVVGAWVRYERGLACYEDAGLDERARAARDMWESAANTS
ncbi:MAG: hypothetical protein QOI47_1529 [Actinomycetota bacterium]|nr:hypothetical protein [Actinomycetota bacterium]